MDTFISTRVNSKRLPQYHGQTVRLACKILKFYEDKALVEACDGGQVEVSLSGNTTVTDTYAEVVGTVTGPASIKLLTCINLGSEIDMKLVNDTVELIHDPRFFNKMFA